MRVVYAPTRDTWKRVSSADEAGFVTCLPAAGKRTPLAKGASGFGMTAVGWVGWASLCNRQHLDSVRAPSCNNRNWVAQLGGGVLVGDVQAFRRSDTIILGAS